MSDATELDAMSLLDRLDAAGELIQREPAEAALELDDICRAADDADEAKIAGDANYLAARARLSLGELDAALSRIESARKRFLDAGCRLDAARTGLGRMNVLDDLGRHIEAIEVGRALLVDLDAGELGDDAARLRAAALENIGVSNGILGRHADALDAYAQAEQRYRDAELEADASRCTANRGVELVEVGRASEALALLAGSAERFRIDGDRLSAGLCVAFEARGHVQCGDYARAYGCLERSDELLADLDSTTEWARAQLVRAETLLSLNLLDDAAALYTSLERRFEESGLRHDAAQAALGTANTLLFLDDHGAARDAFERTQVLSEALGDSAMRAACSLGASLCADESLRLDAARDAAERFGHAGRNADEAQALIRLIELGDGDSQRHLERCDELLASSEMPHIEWQTHRVRAVLHRRAGNHGEALASLHRATQIVEQLRGTVDVHDALIPFLGSRRRLHEDLTDLLLDLDDVGAAFAHVGAARARTLGEHISSDASSDGGTGTASTVVYDIIGQEILAFVQRADGDVDVVRNLTDVRAVQKLLNRLGAQWRRFDEGMALESPPDVEVVDDLLGQLYATLIGPLRLGDDLGDIIVVPVAALANVPFAALHDGEAYLIDRRTLVVSPSVAQRSGHRRRISTRLLVGVGDDAAPLVEHEVASIVGRIRGDHTTLTGTAAVAPEIGRLAPHHDLVHIACHGHNRADNPWLSSLEVADGALSAADIATWPLDGQSVVLSACSSGRQHAPRNADELLGLPRAFLAAGASEVVVNLWPVNDESASELMASLHGFLDQGQVPSTALRNAQLQLRAERPHPFHWAPTVIYSSLPDPFHPTTGESA